MSIADGRFVRRCWGWRGEDADFVSCKLEIFKL